MKHTDEPVTAYPRKNWDKRGLGQETENTRRNLEQKGSPKGQFVELDLGLGHRQVANWGKSGTRNISGGGWGRQMAQFRAEGGRLEVTNVIDSHARTAFDIAHAISECYQQTHR